MTRRLEVVLVAVLAFAGCDLGKSAQKVLAKAPKVDLSLLPGVDGASKLLMDVGQARIEIDPTQSDAITALGECADEVTYCYARGAVDLPGCVEATPTCASATPWTEATCCPSDCKTAYAKAVKKGEAPVDAMERIFFLEPDCFPGVRAALETP